MDWKRRQGHQGRQAQKDCEPGLSTAAVVHDACAEVDRNLAASAAADAFAGDAASAVAGPSGLERVLGASEI